MDSGFSLREPGMTIERDATNQPDGPPGVALAKPGQNTSDYQKLRQSPKSKIFCFARTPKQRHIFAHPVLLRGALAIVTNVGRVAVDADVATDERG
jgi:hypothetical protein